MGTTVSSSKPSREDEEDDGVKVLCPDRDAAVVANAPSLTRGVPTTRPALGNAARSGHPWGTCERESKKALKSKKMA